MAKGRLFERSLERPATLEALRVRHGLLERLSRIQRSISHGAPLEEVFAAIAAGASELLGDPVAGLRLVDEDDPTTMRLVASTGLTPEQLAQVAVGIVGEGAGGRAISQGTTVVVEDYTGSGDGIARFGEFGVQNALAAPVRCEGRVVGSLTVATFEPGRRYDVVEEEILAALAEHAGLALLDASLIDRRERQAERQGEERFRALVRHSSDLIAIVDEEGRVSFATPSVGRVLGVEVDALTGVTLLAHLHPGDRPQAAALLRTAASRPGTMPPDDWRLVPPGAQFQPQRWMHVEVLATNLLDHPAVGGIVLNARNVTERVRAEEQRRRQDARYRQIVDTTHDGVWMTDEDDRTVFVNGALASMLGRAPEDVVGRRPMEFMAPDQARIVRSAMERRRRGVHDRYEVELRRADGSPLHLSISGTPLTDEGRFTGALALCGDITELVRAREENAQLEARLHQAQELEMLGRLAGHVAHDFNQVLAVISGYAELLRRRTDAGGLEDLARIVEAAEHGAALARQLVTFSRRDQGAPEVLDLAEALRAVARLVERTAPAGVAVDLRAGPPVPVVIDRTKLHQILMNLVDNAFDAMPDGGTVTLESARGPAGWAEVVVADTGTGMEPEVAARALEPAFTTKPSGRGTGLGLAIVHGAVQSAGGQVALRSAPGAGTRVELRFPLARTEAAEADGGPVSDAADPAAAIRSATTILLVEDDAAVLALTRRVLEDHGYTVIAAPDAARALEAVEGRDVDLLLTDQTMPGGSGIDLAREVSRRRPGTPAIVMSGYVAEAGAQRPSGIAWLQKPFGASTLLGSVRDALARP